MTKKKNYLNRKPKEMRILKDFYRRVELKSTQCI